MNTTARTPGPGIARATALSREVLASVERAVVGKREELELVLAAVLAGGHVLLEDFPGLGKTLAARSFAQALGLEFTRAQFTPDLLPGDLTGSFLFDPRRQEFSFREGPLFTNLLLADEVNRTPPKTQAALLEAMQEGQITVEGTTFPLARPFHVIATANPVEHEGTYRLPEAQLDRFLVKTTIGYPDRGALTRILADSANPDRSKSLNTVITAPAVAQMADLAAGNHVEDSVLDYIGALVEATRESPDTRLGVSTRGAIAMTRVARVWAASRGRPYVLPDDIKELAEVVWAHRLVMDPDAEFSGATARGVITRALEETPAPTTRLQA